MRDFNCTFREGRITCITGPSGCGKTTLLRMLMGLESPDVGSIAGVSNLRIAAVFQDDRLCENLSAEANLRLVMPRGKTSQQIRCILEELALQNAMRQPVRTLSGGMRRRLSLARALLADYDLLLLDEPFSGLDAEMRLQAANCILNRIASRTAIAVTHDPEEIALLKADAVAFPKHIDAIYVK